MLTNKYVHSHELPNRHRPSSYLVFQVDQDTYWNEQHTSNSAKMAVGSVIELADKVVTGEVKVRVIYSVVEIHSF